MKTAEQIQIDFDRAIGQVRELRGLAGRLEDLADENIEKTLRMIRRGWDGETARQYLQKGRKLKRKAKDCASQLRETAGLMEARAESLYETEQMALRLFSAGRH